jgi:hypothetical protein
MILECRKVLILFLLVDTGCATAQSVKPFDPLGLPTSTLLCRPLPSPQTLRHGTRAFQFEDGVLLVDDRLMSAVYDSVGNPLLLVMTATSRVGDTQPTMHELSVSFPADGPAEGFQLVRAPSAGDAIEPKREVLSPGMIAESRSLAVWLWDHRCIEAKTTKQSPAQVLNGVGRLL